MLICIWDGSLGECLNSYPDFTVWARIGGMDIVLDREDLRYTAKDFNGVAQINIGEERIILREWNK